MTTLDFAALVPRLRAAGCVFAEEEAELLLAAATDARMLESLVAQRVSGAPLEVLLGWTEFRGLRVSIDPGVFVPRQRTGFLVERAVALASALGRRVVALDMCCGSGALGLAFATEMTAVGVDVQLTAADIEPAAVACARRNLAPLAARVYEGDLFDPLPMDLRGRVDILLSNTPYVPSEAIAHMPPEARDHEPLVTLDGGADGLDIFRRVAAAAPTWLAPGGWVLVETSEGQAPVATDILTRHGLDPQVAVCDELGATVVIGRR
ncbi:putative protein N(5)-glutamine methyltransferase [Nocardia sp. NPDC050406]|uniref:putative protein N(5)-glutamine methyltransferase n=1 Tax=Nocardia sp. NPDC050406 TaxID=3364318 RepID=UPI00378919FA